jgi:UDP-N-acetylmuramoyl-L-alanyl-D-glutamate--2,6-diaminopimelate ligase
MGRELLAGSDVAIFTSDNPRSESPEKILEEMVSGLTLGESASVTLDRREAIALAVSSALPGDCVVVLGKGHEVGQEIAGKKYPFDDRIELARAIEELA